MPTVDDLTVSLTIKDNSNLDKLRKNLDEILKTGPGGVTGGGSGGIKKADLDKDFKDIKDMLDNIDDQMDFLLPTYSPNARDRKGQMEYARRISNNVVNLKQKIASFLSPEKMGPLEDLAKDLNIKDMTTENMQEGIEKLLDKYNLIAQSITKGELLLTGGAGKKFLDTLRSVINDILSGGSNLTRLREIEGKIPESLMQRTIEKMLDKLGIVKKGQFTMTKVGIKDEDKDKLDKWIKDVPEGIVDKLKDLLKEKNNWNALLLSLKELGYAPEELQKLLSQDMAKEDEERVKNLIKAILKVFMESGQKGTLGLPMTFTDFVKKEAGVNLRAKGKSSITKLDISTFSGDFSKLKQIIPTLTDEVIKAAEEIGMLPIELKTLLGAGDEGNLQTQREIFGVGGYIVVASMITKTMRDSLDDWGIKYFTKPFWQDIMEESGITTGLQTQEELLRSLIEAIEDTKGEEDIIELKRLVNKVIDIVKPISEKTTTIGDPLLKQAYETISEIARSMGLRDF